MRDNHIIKMLEEKTVSRLSEGDINQIEAHVAVCPVCQRAYDAARLAHSLIRARASQATEVSPFFETRVMAAIREKRLQPELPAIVNWWRAARAILSAMAAMIVVLIGLTVFSYGPEQQTQSPEMISQNTLSPEYILSEDEESDDDMPYDQVLATMYGLEDGDGN